MMRPSPVLISVNIESRNWTVLDAQYLGLFIGRKRLLFKMIE